MNNDALASVDKVDEKVKPWSAQVELGQVQFLQNPDLGIDFYNQIDAWRKMEVSFKHKIERPRIKRARKEFTTLYYSYRENVV
jgi:hypothetical protein